MYFIEFCMDRFFAVSVHVCIEISDHLYDVHGSPLNTEFGLVTTKGSVSNFRTWIFSVEYSSLNFRTKHFLSRIFELELLV